VTQWRDWHVDDATVARYARGQVSLSVGASVESHLVTCDRCRALLAPVVDTGRLESLWDAVLDRVEAPPPTPVERVLRMLGLPEGTARLLAATPALRGSWLLAMAGALLFAAVATVATGGGAHGTLLFLVVAPVLPVAGVAAAFHRGVDPTYEIGLAAPYPQFRLLLLRSAAVTAVTCAAASVAGALLPTRTLTAAAWLLPALALTSLTLVLSRRLDVGYAAAVVGGAWLLIAVVTHTGVERFAVFGTVGQLVCGVVLTASLIVLVADRERYAAALGGV
jgi:hypothetical protein